MQPILSNPNYGWCDFTLGEFHGTPSYLTDVPIDVLQACLDYKYNGYGMACFDEEGSTFILILMTDNIYLITENEKAALYKPQVVNTSDIVNQMVKDIEKDLVKWVNFLTYDENDENERKIIQNQLYTLILDFKSPEHTHKSKYPQKIEIWNGQAACPSCGRLFGNIDTIKNLFSWEMPYCKYCGQAINWGNIR